MFAWLVLYLALDVGNQFRVQFVKILMEVEVIAFASFLGEAVHVELPDVGVHIAVLEVVG